MCSYYVSGLIHIVEIQRKTSLHPPQDTLLVEIGKQINSEGRSGECHEETPRLAKGTERTGSDWEAGKGFPED